MDLEISCDALEALQRTGESVYLVDVREVPEFSQGHLQGAHLATLGPDLFRFLDEHAGCLDACYVFICTHGKRSAEAARLARQGGFSQALSLKGGLQAWVLAGKKLVGGQAKFDAGVEPVLKR